VRAVSASCKVGGRRRWCWRGSCRSLPRTVQRGPCCHVSINVAALGRSEAHLWWLPVLMLLLLLLRCLKAGFGALRSEPKGVCWRSSCNIWRNGC
jgi:hypothetical protein